MTAQIDVGRDFSRYPAGRNLSDGDYSGEAFRERILVPNLRENDQVVVDLDTVAGYGSSFLEEAFGGLVRCGHFSAGELHKKLRLATSDRSLEQEIWEYIDQAKRLRQ